MIRIISTLTRSLALRGWTVVDAYVMGSQVSGGRPPHAKSDLDLLLMIDEYRELISPPRGLQYDIADCIVVLEDRIGREVHAQTVPPGFFPQWLIDINYKRIHWTRGVASGEC